MFAFFKRLFGIGKAYTLIEKQNDPTKMTAEEIKDLRTALNDEIKKHDLQNNIKYFGRPEAAKKIVAEILKVGTKVKA